MVEPMLSVAPHRRAVRIIGAENLALLGVLLLLTLVPTVADAFGQPFYLRVLTRILIFGIAALSLDLVLGFGGMISLGHAAFLGIAGYVVGILAWHVDNAEPLLTWPFLIGGSENALIVWPLAIAATAVAALIIGAISLRTDGLYFIMITMAFAQMLHYLTVSLDRYGGDDGLKFDGRSHLPGLDLSHPGTFYYLVLVLLAFSYVFAVRLTRSRFGLVIQGCRQNARRMQAIGIASYRYRLICFVIAGAMAGLAGVLMANLDTFVSPADLSVGRSSELIVMVVLGGMRTLYGPVLGAAFYLLAELLLGDLTIHWQAILGLMVIAIILPGRRGLVGLFRDRVRV